MAGGYGQRWKGPLGARDDAMGGAAANLGIEALLGEGDMVTIFDDFNDHVPAETFGDAQHWEQLGWVLTDVGAPAADAISMNAAATATLPYDSCIRINAGTAADAGGLMQLDRVNGAATVAAATISSTASATFPHIWIAESGAGAGTLDNMDIVFACRIGVITNDTAAGDWDGKFFIGFAEAGDAGILTAASGAITQPETGPLIGWHAQENGALRAVSQRTVNTAYAAQTNFLTCYGTGGLDSTLANGAATIGDPMWFDLAIRMHITDMSDNAANGTTSFYHRRVAAMNPAPGSQDFPSPFQTVGPWNDIAASAAQPFRLVLSNQTPNNDIALVPTIELINGPAQLSDLLIDWWAFGISRYSRTRKP